MAFPDGWGQYHKITVDSSKVVGNVNNFVVPLVGGNFLATVYSNTQANGEDLRFSLDTSGASQLPFEVVNWSTASITSGEVYVKTDSLATASDKEIFCWYDNDSASALSVDDDYGRNAVWSDYVAVYHLNDTYNGSASEVVDSAGTWHGFSDETAPTRVAGRLGIYANNFNDNAALNLGNVSVLNEATGLYINSWFNPDTLQVVGVITRRQTDYAGFSHGLYNPSDELSLATDEGDPGDPDRLITRTDTLNLGTDSWHHSQVTWNGNASNVHYYVIDGEIESNSIQNGSGATKLGTAESTDRVVIGADWRATSNYDFYFDGFLEEIRISDSDRSTAFMKTEFNAQATTSLFSSPSDPVAYSSPAGGDTDPVGLGCLTMMGGIWGRGS